MPGQTIVGLQRSLVVLCLAVCCFMTTGRVNAQISTDVATDQELFAAYCLGVAAALAEMPTLTNQIRGLELDPVVVEADRSMKENLDRHVSRFHGYLVARSLES